MVTVMFLQAWGAHGAQTIAEVTESQAEPLVATGVAMLVDLAPNVFEDPPPAMPAKTPPLPPKPLKPRVQRIA